MTLDPNLIANALAVFESENAKLAPEKSVRDRRLGAMEKALAAVTVPALPQEPAPDYSNLLSVITDIRMKSGVGAKPMLSELADAIAARIAAPVASPLVGEDALERYQATTPFGGDMVSNPQGQWVRFEDAMAKIAALSAASIPTGVSGGPWCQPMKNGEHQPRTFMVYYEDQSVGVAVFDNEADAREHWGKANTNWNCYLFGTLPIASPVGGQDLPVAGETVESLFPNCDLWGAKEWFQRLVKAVNRRDDAVRAGNQLAYATHDNIASSTASRIVHDYAGEILSALSHPAPERAMEALPPTKEYVDRLIRIFRDRPADDTCAVVLIDYARAALARETDRG